MSKKFFLFVSALAVLAAYSCTGGSTADVFSEGDTIPLKYAQNITMVRYGEMVKVELSNPWGKGLLATYVLTPDRSLSSPSGREGKPWVYVPVPLRKALVFTAVHCGLICELGMEDCIGGVCERQYIHCLTHEVVDCGNGMSPNQERIIQLHPDAMLVSPFESNTGHDKLGQLGIPVIECAEYMEPTALGRAEWMKFYGLLLGREAEANALFEALEARYDSLRTLAGQVSVRPRILSENAYLS